MSKKFPLRTLAFAFAASASLSASAQALSPFNTAINHYIYIGQAGMNAASGPGLMHSTTVPSSAVLFSTGQPIIGVNNVKFNGIGLSQQDGFLYALSFTNTPSVSTAPFFRIGANSVATQIGVIPAPPIEPGTFLSAINVSAGVVDAANNYWFSAYTLSGNPFAMPWQASQFKMYIGRISNLSSLTPGTSILAPTYYQLNISDPALQAAVQSFLTHFNYSNPDNSYGGVQDFAIHPANGLIYAMFSYPTSPNGTPIDNPNLQHRPVVVNPTTWVANVVGNTINSAPNWNELAGTYFTPTGNYYALFTSGQYAQVNLTTGGLINLTQSNLPVSPDANVANKVDLRGDLASNINGTPTSIPVSGLNGWNEGSVNRLEWNGAKEDLVVSYFIDRSADGKKYETIGRVNALGSVRHSFTDEQPLAVGIYRIRSADRIGDVAYSASVRISGQGIVAGTTAFPTLLEGNTSSIRILTTADKVQATVTDLAGRILIATTLTNEGGSALNLTLPNLATGQYILSVRNAASGESLLTQRIEKR